MTALPIPGPATSAPSSPDRVPTDRAAPPEEHLEPAWPRRRGPGRRRDASSRSDVRRRRPGPPRRRAAGALAPALALIAACSPSPIASPPDALEVVVAGGDGQHGTTGVELPEALRVVVREHATTRPAENVRVRWTVDAGDASLAGPELSVTDGAGVATVTVRLGSEEGEVTVSAALTDGSATASFRLFLVGTPALASLTPASVAAGDTVILSGENFSALAEQNVVLFSGIRGRVLEASRTDLHVEVPSCLPPRIVEVEARLGAVASGALPLVVEEGGEVLELAPGARVDVVDEEALACLRLPGASGARYLAVTHTTSTVGAAVYGYELHGLVSGGPVLAGGAATDLAGTREAAARTRRELPLQDAWDGRIRARERELVGAATGAEPAAAREAMEARGAPAPGAVPVEGERRSFHVYNGREGSGPESFASVEATARYVGDHVALFVDDAAPPGGFTRADLEAFAARFDRVIHPEVRATFGDPSDLDGNGVVVVLFTPVVNEMTPVDATSFVGGFFYGRDLLPHLPYSNASEIFYALVPDPGGVHSGPRPVDLVLQSVPAILAHEFQHMVHFNERVLKRAPSGRQDALWMLEALAQMAEEVVARRYLAEGDPASARLFREGNRRRSRLYLEATDTVSLVAASGQGTLGERGAGFLFLLYLDAHHGSGLLGRLTRSGRTGVANVEAEAGRSWTELTPDWWEATYRDDGGGGSGPQRYPGFDLEAFLGEGALTPDLEGARDFRSVGSLPSSAARYHLLEPPRDGTLSLRLAGPAGGPHARGAGMRLRIVRVP